MFSWVFHFQIYLSFSHIRLSFSLLYPSSRNPVCESVFCDKKVSQSFHLCNLRSWRLWPWRTCRFVWCIDLAGTSEELANSRVLEGTHCRCCGTEWYCEIDYSGNPSLRWRRGRRTSGSNLETILPALSKLLFLLLLLYLRTTIIYIIHLENNRTESDWPQPRNHFIKLLRWQCISRGTSLIL